MTKRKSQIVAGALLIGSAGVLGTAGNPAAGTASSTATAPETAETRAALRPLNNSGSHGSAQVTVAGRRIDVSVDAKRLLRGMPHAQHIHFGAEARHECPTVRDDDNADHRINTVEGQPAYGPVKVSFTKRGDTSPKSTLAVNRFPKAPEGQIHYDRDGIEVNRRVARAIRHGNAVVVIHGIDYNNNGKYDFGAGKSELDPALPAEATDPVSCGRLRPVEDQGGLPLLPLP